MFHFFYNMIFIKQLLKSNINCADHYSQPPAPSVKNSGWALGMDGPPPPSFYSEELKGSCSRVASIYSAFQWSCHSRFLTRWPAILTKPLRGLTQLHRRLARVMPESKPSALFSNVFASDHLNWPSLMTRQPIVLNSTDDKISFN